MKFDTMFVAFVIVTIMVTGTVLMIKDLDSNYDDVNISAGELEGTFDYIEDMSSIATDSEDSTLSAKIDNEDESWNSIVKGSYQTLVLLKKAPLILNNATTSAGNLIGIPPLLSQGFTLVFLITLIFSIIYMIFRFIPR